MADPDRGDDHRPATDRDHDPVGTLAILIGFLVLVAAMWILAYYLLLTRS